MKKINFEVGKFYIDGHGNKWECLKNDLKNNHPIVMTDGCTVQTFTLEGNYRDNPKSSNNIIGEWVEKPVVNWDVMPAWANWVAMDENGKWWWYSRKPSIGIFSFHSSEGNNGRIPRQYAPKFERDWKESLVERPK